MPECDILLINPRYKSEKMAGYDRVPAGLGYIARAVELAGFKYAVVDLNLSPDSDIFEFMRRSAPAFVGISLMSFRVEENYELLSRIKGAFPGAVIIAGGPHVIAAGSCLLDECAAIDIACAGEGEETVVELLGGKPLPEIKGIFYRNAQGAIAETGRRDFITDLDHVPFPVYNGFALDRYSKRMPLASSRGCCYKCSFCGAPRFLGDKWRKRSAEGMFEEFKFWHDRGWREFVFEDSLFSLDKKRVADFCGMVVKAGLKAEFAAEGLRADHLDRATLEKMKAAGFTSVSFGVESAANHVLAAFDKGETIERIEETIAAADSLGFAIGLFFILGGPGETVADARKSFEFALKYENVSYACFFKLVPIPGSPYFRYALEKGWVDKDAPYPSDNFGFETTAAFGNGSMSAAELTGLLKEARLLERKVRERYAVRRALKKMPVLNKIAGPLFGLYKFVDGILPAGAFLVSMKRATADAKSLFEKVRGRAGDKARRHDAPGLGGFDISRIEFERPACDLCGSTARKALYKKPDDWLWPNDHEYQVVECLRCGLVFVDPRPLKKHMRAFYPGNYYSCRGDAGHLKRYEAQLRFLPLLSNEKVLDLGCARGDFLIFLKKKYPGIDAIGVEPYARTIKDGGVNFYEKDLKNCGFEDEEFDLVTAWGVLEHLHHPSEYFEEIFRILKKNGRFIFLVTNSESLYGRRAYREDLPRHLHHFSEKTLAKYAEKYGFQFTRCRYDDSVFDGRGHGTFNHIVGRAAGVGWKERRHGGMSVFKKIAVRLGNALDTIAFGLHWEAFFRRSGIIIAEFRKSEKSSAEVCQKRVLHYLRGYLAAVTKSSTATFAAALNCFYLNFYFRRENAIFTHLTTAEKIKLMELAAVANGGVFVEIGSYLGSSSCFISAGIKKAGGRARLYCVDTWRNDSMNEGPRDTFDEFIKNVGGYAELITPVRENSVSAAENFENGINFLFIDGGHSYEEVKADAEAWLPKVVSGGVVIFHDCGWAEGVKKVVREVAAPVTTGHGSLPNMWWGYIK